MQTFEKLGYTNDDASFSIDVEGIRKIGRAKNLTPELLKMINEWKYTTYYKFNFLGSPNTFDILHLIQESHQEFRVLGKTLFDVNGNMVNVDMPYEKEDKMPFFKINCSNQRIKDAVIEFEDKMNSMTDDSYDDYYKKYHFDQYNDICEPLCKKGKQ